MDFKKVAPEAIGVNGATMPFDLSMAGDIFEMGEKQDMHRYRANGYFMASKSLPVATHSTLASARRNVKVRQRSSAATAREPVAPPCPTEEYMKADHANSG